MAFQHSITITIQTDTSGALDCEAVFRNLWLQWKWFPEWQPLSIMAEDLVPIICSCAVWGPKLTRKSILFQGDNLRSLVTAINKGSCKDKLVMQLLRILIFFVTHFDMHITSTCITGTINVSANYLSWFDMSSFFSLNSQDTDPQHHYHSHSYNYSEQLTQTGHLRSQEAVQQYLGNGIASSTKRMYASGVQHYIDFCTQTQCLPIPTSENTILLFVAHLAMQQLSHTSIKVYLSAMHNLHVISGNHHHFTKKLIPRLQMVLNSIKREQVTKNPSGLGVPSQQSLCFKSTPSCHNNHTATITSCCWQPFV